MLPLRSLVPEADIEKFKHNVELARRDRDSIPIELLLILLAFIRPHIGDLAISST